MNQIDIQYYDTKLARFMLGSFNSKLCLLSFRSEDKITKVDKRVQKYFNAVYIQRDNEVLQKTRRQLQEYLDGERKEFSIPLITAGSEFQNKVWQGLLEIPYGKTISYKELAHNIKNEKAVRAAANANGANAIGIIIPCHRVISSDGTIGGYSGGVEFKKQLLNLEMQNS